MSAEVVNLRRHRKAKRRAAKADAAAQNRLTFGRSKEQHALAEKVERLEQRHFEAHRLEPAGTRPADGDAAGDMADGA